MGDTSNAEILVNVDAPKLAVARIECGTSVHELEVVGDNEVPGLPGVLVAEAAII